MSHIFEQTGYSGQGERPQTGTRSRALWFPSVANKLYDFDHLNWSDYS